ncbi:MAG: mechanosensitive ion channel [Nitratireductor sp.]|nr:mechanosensitive ion channel [Nitratireductor sp.]MCC0020436.1 mechanosensitive ion channel [Nitratireductor sp.]
MDWSTIDLKTIVANASDVIVSYAFSLLGALLLIIGGFVVAGLLKRWTQASLGRLNRNDATLNQFLSNVVQYGVLILVGVMVLGQFGVQTASILAALGAAGLAIGLALQGTLQNIAAGVMLLVLRPFKVGDFIDASGIDGVVEEVGLFATQMRTPDGRFLFAPNSQLWNKSIINFSRNKSRRNDLEVGIGYDDDIDETEAILIKLASEDERVKDSPAPETYVSTLGDSAVSVTLRYWTNTSDYWKTSLDLRKRAKQALDQAGISIPFPQMDMHIVSAPDAMGSKPAKKTSSKKAA